MAQSKASELEEARLEAWQPEPLVPDLSADEEEEAAAAAHALNARIVASKPAVFTRLANIAEPCLNLAAPNFLALADSERLEKAAKDGVAKYGVGSCGPRAFYGTMDVHLQLEQAIAKFLNVQEALLYSFGFSTLASAIPAYAKAKDIVFVDECCNFALQQGINVSRATVVMFQHNDVEHLRRLIVEQFGREKLLKTRSFLIVEGLYEKTGTICKLKEFVKLKHEFKIRLFVDESNSLGVVGATGRGVTEHFNVDVNDVDLIMGSLEKALCSYGGFCAGSSYVVDHQRIAGSGYIFSASLPPFQVKVALEALRIVDENDGQLVRDARAVFEAAHAKLKSRLKHYTLISEPASPIKHLLRNKFIETSIAATKLTSTSNNDKQQQQQQQQLPVSAFTLCRELLGDANRMQLRFSTTTTSNSPTASSKKQQQQLSPARLKAVNEFKAEQRKLAQLADSLLQAENIMLTAAQYILDEEFSVPLPTLKLQLPGSSRVQIDKLIDALNNKQVI